MAQVNMHMTCAAGRRFRGVNDAIYPPVFLVLEERLLAFYELTQAMLDCPPRAFSPGQADVTG
jgi:hypothetical protein